MGVEVSFQISATQLEIDKNVNRVYLKAHWLRDRFSSAELYRRLGVESVADVVR